MIITGKSYLNVLEINRNMQDIYNIIEIDKVIMRV